MKVRRNTLKSALSSSLAGAVNGLFGGGGGMIAVPVLKNILGYDEKRAHATAILIIAPVCAASAITYILGGYFVPKVVFPAALGGIVGGLVGASLLNKLPDFVINIVFISLMFAAGLRMLF